MTTTGTDRTPRTWAVPLETYPSLSMFARDLVTGKGRAAELTGRANLESLEPRQQPRNRETLAEALARANRSWGNHVDDMIEDWHAGKTVTLVAGQQVGIGGGPVYTLAKIASMIAMRRRLETRGIATTILFWLATEDHDYDEVARLDIATSDGIERIRGHATEEKRPVGALEIPQRLRRELCRALGIEREPAWLRAGISFRDSFAELLSNAIPGQIVLVDSLLPELRANSRDLLHRLASSLEEIEAEIADRSENIANAGYQPQVQKSEDGHYSLLYAIDDHGRRQPVRRLDGGWVAGDTPIDLDSLIEAAPERVSTGALARPLLQDSVFEPDVFVGGPAEVAYYAQLAGLHAMLGIHRPQIALRGHALIAPSKVLRSLERHGIRPEEVFDSTDAILLRRERERARDVGLVAARMEADLVRGLEEMKTIVLDADPSLARPLDRTARKVHYHLARLADRGRQTLARRDRERHQAVERASRILLPGGITQDRTIGWVSYWLTYGPRVVNRLIEEIDPDANELRIVGV